MKLPFSSLWAEFKAFAFQGNMIELAVAVVIGGAFGTVIHSLVEDVIMPTVGYAIHTGEAAAEKAKEAAQSVASHAGLQTATPATAPTTQAVIAVAPPIPPAPVVAAAPTAAAKPDQPVNIDLMLGPVPVGKFITALINFLLVALAVFLMIVKLLGGVMKKFQAPTTPGEPTTRECPECLSIIPIKAKRCSHCTAVIEPAVV